MATEEQIGKVLLSLDEIQACPRCRTRLRFGDVECPRCGEDILEGLRAWAGRLIDRLSP